jgi:hypothetical protein
MKINFKKSVVKSIMVVLALVVFVVSCESIDSDLDLGPDEKSNVIDKDSIKGSDI